MEQSREGKIKRGWRLTKVAWTLIRRDPTMLLLAFLGVASALVFTALVLYLGGFFSNPADRHAGIGLLALLALYPSVLLSSFFNVALASAASAAFDGEKISAGEALRIAYGKRGRIALWAAISAFIGLIISEIASRLPGGDRVVGWLAGAAWGLATIFVIPILAIEGIGSVDAVKRSAGMVKSRWGEGLTGNVAITAWSTIVTIPVAFLFGIGVALVPAQPGIGFALIAIGAVAIVAISTVVATTRQVFAVALYRYAIDAPIGGFSEADLVNPFTGRKSGEKRKSWILRIGVPILAIFFILGIVGAILNHGRNDQTAHTTAEGYFSIYHPVGREPHLRPGTAVTYRGVIIGEVLSLTREGGTAYNNFHVDPRYASIVQAGHAHIVFRGSQKQVCIGTAAECPRRSPSPGPAALS